MNPVSMPVLITPLLAHVRGLLSISLLTVLLNTVLMNSANALLPGGMVNNVSFTTGHIAAVGIEKDAAGNPILAEFDSTGSIVGELTAFSGRADLRVMPAQDYRTLVSLLNQLLNEHPGSTVMSLAQYNSRHFSAINGDKIKQPPVIRRDTRSVLMVDERQLLVTDPPYESVILQEFPLDLSHTTTLSSNINTLLIDNNGAIVYQSQYDISYKVGIFKKDESGRRINPTTPITPVANALVYSGMLGGSGFGGGLGVSDETGKYLVIVVIPPCPGFAYSTPVPITAQVFVANFNPKAQGKRPGFIPVSRFDEKFCSGYSANPPGLSIGGLMAQINAFAIEAALDTNTYNFNMWMSTMQLNAIGVMPGIKLADATTYSSDDDTAIAELTPGSSRPDSASLSGDYLFDFDGDGSIDTVVPNPLDANKVDVYLNGRSEFDELGNRNEPDITRLKDHDPLAQRVHQGRLKTISKTDLQNTDIYIYRASTNQLIGQLEGLLERDDNELIIGGADNDSGLLYKGVHNTTSPASFGFSSLLIGAASFDQLSDLNFSANRLRRPWTPSQSGAANFDSKTTPDFLRPGEQVKIIAINRATGYIGSIKTRLKEIYNIPTKAIELHPPNLKIIATRSYEDVAGLSAGQIHNNQLIGSEGAGLTSDKYINIQTIWLARDGSVLPDNLPGYTARLAISTGSATEDIATNFEIKPGYHTQVVRLKGSDLTTEHFYVQVIGENFDGNPSFASPGAGTGKLQTRPAKYTPVLVPIFNEQATIKSQNALRDARQQGIQNLPDKAKPVYHWVYRPEMQFSVFDLEVNDIRISDIENSFNESIIDLANPVISTDYIVDVFLTLLEPDENPLEFFGPGQDFVLQIGENEYNIASNESGEQNFVEIDSDHFSDLSVDDYLTISVFLNNDAANVLWEFGSTLEPIAYPASGDITADEGEQDIIIVQPGFSSTDKENVSVTLQWSVIGSGGSVTELSTISDSGFHLNKIVTSQNAGDEFRLAVKIINSSHPSFAEGTEYSFGPFNVTAGEPETIILTRADDTLRADTVSKTTIEAEVFDRFGNHVEDGTIIKWFVQEHSATNVQESQTQNGIANVTVTADDRVGNLIVAAQSGEAVFDTVIEKTDFTVNVNVASNNAIPEGSPITVTANIPGAINGTPISWVSTLGVVEGESTINGESAIATFQPGAFAGTAKIFASVGQQWARTNITLAYPLGVPTITLDDPVLIGDRTINEMVSVDRLDGTFRTFEAKTNTNMNVSGLIPGETYIVRLGTTANPNVEPIAWYFMDDIIGEEAPDIYHDHPGQVSNITVDRTMTSRGTGSYLFDAISQLTIPANTTLDLENNFGLGIAVRPNNGQQSIELITKQNHYGLRLEKEATGYRPTFWVNTSNGEQQLQSTSLIPFDEWQEIAVKEKNNTLTITVGSTENNIALSGAILSSNTAIIVGNGFEGHLDNFKIFNLSNLFIAGFADSSVEIELIADANGEINTSVHSLGNLRTASPLTWITDARIYWKQQQGQVTELDTAGGFITFMTYGMAEQLANLMAQVVWDEGEGGSAIVYEFAASAFIIGDVRDILKYGGKWYFGLADDTEKLLTTLGFVGILTTTTPVADQIVTALKIVVKKAANTPAANAIAEIGRKVVDEVVSGSFATIEKFSKLFVELATADITREFFQRGVIRNLDELDVLNTFYKTYPVNANVILTRLYSKMDGKFPAEIAEQKVNDLLKGLVDINTVIGKELSDDGIDGLAALIKVDGINSARLGNMARFLRPPVDVELESALKAAKGIDELPIKPEGYAQVFKEFASKSSKQDRKMRGALTVLRDVGSDAFGGVTKIDKFEFDASVDIVINGVTRTFSREVDVLRKGSPARLEHKAWEKNTTRWGAIHGAPSSGDGSWEFVRDVLYQGGSSNFQWVIRGTDLSKVQKNMLQTLGVETFKGSKKLHPVLEEAIESGNLTRGAYDAIVQAVKDGTLLRKAGD